MIVEWDSEDRSGVRHLFEPHKRARAIIFPALDLGLGKVWTDSHESPRVARLQLSAINALAGDSSSSDAVDIVRMIEPMQLVFGHDDNWTFIIKELWDERLGVQARTVFSSESLDLDHLRVLQEKIPSGYQLERMSLEDVQRIDKRKAMHIPIIFGSSEDFCKKGIGFCIKHNNKIVCMASTFTPYTDMFEIQVDTFDIEHRRKGLATITSAALMVYALENGITPYWDAANEASIQLALKLGYTDPEPWEAYYLKPVSGTN